ncbi:formyltetrahydrofolate deformylase [Chelatococcus reniformis]|uniref:Formyltetrahydrofolate deformylase n=1 Tax=Chelatococcus reniformis TaxID=1494448 RepID=A0A916USY0_9HYPH|nr:formyltetrahydrofolate deformylase [Chelatococcus reniformis]GGC86262.1 formyltetrahydrofolate deformylase [Chelatococcus reniformis]
MTRRTWILTLSCQDRPRIVATITTAIANVGANISESAQFGDSSQSRFFMRIAFDTPQAVEERTLRGVLAPAVAEFDLTLTLNAAEDLPRIIIMVSKFDHCLEHLLYQIRVGWLKAHVVAIVSNHEASQGAAEAMGIPFHVWPVTRDNKAEQEAKLLELYRERRAELVVLARYMQILSNELSTELFGQVINIHHSFLPSFKGAKPYHQAYERGVKIIGASSHYVTPDLDEGPIIEQETERVTHALSTDDLVAVGRDIESRVLARAVKLHLERRVLINGRKTVVF